MTTIDFKKAHGKNQLPVKSDEAQVATTVEVSEVEVGEDGGSRRKAELG